MAVFGIARDNDEIKQYQMGRYISTNEAIWRILSFNIHERYPTVTHLAVHLENGQRVYFTEQNAAQIALRPPVTTLTDFFDLCHRDDFAKTLLYSDMRYQNSIHGMHRQKNSNVEKMEQQYRVMQMFLQPMH